MPERIIIIIITIIVIVIKKSNPPVLLIMLLCACHKFKQSQALYSINIFNCRFIVHLFLICVYIRCI